MSGNSQVQFVKVEDNSVGQRLDNFLVKRLKGCPKSLIYRIIRKGEVRVNRKRAKPETRLEAGDEIRIPPVRLADRSAPPRPGHGLSNLLLGSVLAETEDFLVVNKPPGLPVHGGSGVRLGLIEAIRQLRPDWRELELVHRLDRDTSGCMVISKNSTFLREINRKLKQKTVTKIYLALVQGYWPDNLREVNVPLQKNRLESGERMVRVDPQGKSALTRFRVIEHFGTQATLIEATLETGRTHQIRVHCRHAGHPILGDPKYGDRDSKSPVTGITRLCLHAVRLEFNYPETGPLYQFQAPTDADFDGIVKLLRSQQKTA